MNKILFLIILFSSIILTNTNHIRCGFTEGLSSSIREKDHPESRNTHVSPSGHFYIHYEINGSDAPSLIDDNLNNIPDYIEEVGIIADESRNVLINIMGYNAEPQDSDGIYDIYVEDLGYLNYGVNTLLGEGEPGSSYIKIDNEYEEEDYCIPGINTMRLTVAHEFFHAIQRGYSSPNNNTAYFFEMSATWIEDIIVPDGDDYLCWTDDFFNNPTQDIDDIQGYSTALFLHYLTQVIEDENNQIESSIVREIWEQMITTPNVYYSISSILEDYETNFERSWVDFCSRNLYNGIENGINNIYYYDDQQYAQSINISSINSLNGDVVISDLILTNKSAQFLAFEPLDEYYINIPNLDNQIYGQFAIISDDLLSNNIIEIQDSDFLDVSPSNFDILYLVLGTSIGGIYDFNILVDDFYNLGDINLDGMIDVLDIVLLSNEIVTPGILNSLQLMLADMNYDNIVNIVDIILIISIILS